MNNYTFAKYVNDLLQINKFQDYCPNGLQVEGASVIEKIITGVSLNDKLIDVAIHSNANAIIVHHGVFWNNEERVITKVKKQRIAKLLKHNINLYAYHLPLDNHAELGNNVQLAKLLNINILGNTDKHNLLWYGELRNPCSLDNLLLQITKTLDRKPDCFTNAIIIQPSNNNQMDDNIIKSIAWCTGGADDLFSSAINLGVDAYITGEFSEPVKSLAEESGVHFISAGHYATERYGIMALTEYIRQHMNLDANFVELYNPI